MALKKYKPTTPGQRFKLISAYDDITTDRPEKSLIAGKKSTGGRNNEGRMTIRNVGGGHKKKYRIQNTSFLPPLSWPRPRLVLQVEVGKWPPPRCHVLPQGRCTISGSP